VGILVSGFAPADILRLSQPLGQTFEGWQPNFPTHTQWLNEFDVILDGNPAQSFRVSGTGISPSSSMHGAIYATAADARAAFGVQTLTGASTYLFYIDDNPIADNTHGVSVLVEKGVAVGNTHAGIRLFGGNVANIDVTGNEATINIKGKVNLLDQYAPRNLYQLGCEHAFCDPGCTLLRSAFTLPYTVGSSPTRTFIPWSGTPPANATNYRFGTVTFTSGVCSGQARTVRSADSTGLTLIHPLIGTPAAGDGFTAFEGCDKALNSGSGQDCTARSNTQNWRAFPFVPPADTAF
jgi:uncharacterized phage protein (TIGR02218 family)